MRDFLIETYADCKVMLNLLRFFVVENQEYPKEGSTPTEALNNE